MYMSKGEFVFSGRISIQRVRPTDHIFTNDSLDVKLNEPINRLNSNSKENS
jgi:hypothetical protein